MPRVPPPEHVHIPALKRQQVVDRGDLMQPGQGTPWEDRGHLGLASGFRETVVMAVLRPLRLLDSIRRPDSLSDANQLALVTGVLTAVGVAGHVGFWRWRTAAPWSGLRILLDLLGLAALLAAPWLLSRVGARVNHAMTSAALKGRARLTLNQSIFAYLFCPLSLAVVPLVGPPLAALIVAALAVVVPRLRLRLTLVEGLIAGAVSFLVMLLTVLAGYLAWHWALPWALGPWFGE